MRVVFSQNLVWFPPLDPPFFLISITDISSDAESRKEQDGRKQNSIGPTTAELWPTLWPYVSEKMKKW